MKTTIFAMSLVIAISGCANMGADYVPMVDLNTKDSSNYAADLSDCQDFARQTAGAGEGAMIGAVAIGFLMAVLAPSGYRQDWAASGVAAGAAGGAVGAMESQRTIVKRCLNNRGYSVLN